MRRLVFAAAVGVVAVGWLLAQHRSAPATPAQKPSVTPEEVSSFMYHTFGWNPQLKWQVASVLPSDVQGLVEAHVQVTSPQGQQPFVFYITPDGRHAITGELVPFGADPFGAAQAELAAQAKGPAKGPKTAPLLIVEFSDLQCPHCKQAQPTVEKLLADNPNSRFVFESFPIPGHDWAVKGAAYADCVYQENPEAVWKFISASYDAQESITSANVDQKLADIAKNAGANPETVASCAARPETQKQIEEGVRLAKQVGVTGTPTLFLNGRKIANVSGTPYEALNAIARFQAGQGAAKAR